MMIFGRVAVLVAGLGVLGVGTFAMAQENLDAGKSGAQLYAADCSVCHKLPEGVFKAHAVFGLEGFLRQHYAASQESAAVIADYLRKAENRHAPPRTQSSNREVNVNGKRAKLQRRKLGEDKSKDATETEPKLSKKPGTKSADKIKSEEPKSDKSKSDKSKSDTAGSEKSSAEKNDKNKPASAKQGENAKSTQAN